MVPCKLCSSLGGKAEFSTLDEQKTHAQFHQFQLGYINSEDGDRTALKETFANCFPSEDFEKPKKLIGNDEEIEKSRSTLMEISKRIIVAKANETNSISCQICRSKVRYTSNDGKRTDANRILAHACYHSSKKAFTCRQECQQVSATKSDMVKHVKRIHKIGSPIAGVHFDENWTDCFDDIKESLTDCFGDIVWAPLPSKKAPTPPSELTIQRRSVLKKILESANEDKKIRCIQCQKYVDMYHLKQHIDTHLGRRIYECTKCETLSIHSCSITHHLANEHGAPSKGNYIDHSDEYHEDIMDLLKKCFGKDASK